MKRFHVHIAVDDLATSVAFYSKLFGQQPAKLRDDYAKWMLDDPRVNFAISARGHEAGVNHFGMQVETPEELAALKTLADDASAGATLVQGETACCYAKSDKHWTIDPTGIAWEHYLTMGDVVAFGEEPEIADKSGACCVPVHTPPEKAESAGCCVPNDSAKEQGSCCG